MVDLSTVNGHLIGISFLKEEENSCVKTLWNNRFPKSEACFAQADLNESPSDLLQKTISAITAGGGGNLAGRSCIVTLFLDIREGITAEQVKTLSQISKMLQTALFCTVSTEVQFAYIGTNPVPEDDLERTKETVAALSAACNEKAVIVRRMGLVAKTMMDGEGNVKNWEAVIIFLDMMRRSNVGLVIPTAGMGGNDDVLFLRYGEYDSPRRNALSSTAAQLKKSLSNEGETALRNLIAKTLEDISRNVSAAVPVQAEKQQIHPGMTVDGFFARRSAIKGNNRDFNAAQAATKLALIETGKEMEKKIHEMYESAIAPNATSYLFHLIEAASVGLGLLSDSEKMTGILAPEKASGLPPAPPALAYKEDGYLSEIRNYLESVQAFTKQKAVANFMDRLLKAYQNISQDYYDRQYADRKKRLQDTENALDGMPDETVFLRDAEGAGTNLSSSFYPVRPGGQSKRMVLEYDFNTGTDHERQLNADVTVMYLPKLQLISPDPIATKGLHVLSFNCTSERLEDLIKGV